jgi:F0F1-type ATP synthase membrane subunit b/b'
MNLEAQAPASESLAPVSESFTQIDTVTIIALWLLLAAIVYFVFTKTLKGFFKKSEEKIADSENFTERLTQTESIYLDQIEF